MSNGISARVSGAVDEADAKCVAWLEKWQGTTPCLAMYVTFKHLLKEVGTFLDIGHEHSRARPMLNLWNEDKAKPKMALTHDGEIVIGVVEGGAFRPMRIDLDDLTPYELDPVTVVRSLRRGLHVASIDAGATQPHAHA